MSDDESSDQSIQTSNDDSTSEVSAVVSENDESLEAGNDEGDDTSMVSFTTDISSKDDEQTVHNEDDDTSIVSSTTSVNSHDHSFNMDLANVSLGDENTAFSNNDEINADANSQTFEDHTPDNNPEDLQAHHEEYNESDIDAIDDEASVQKSLLSTQERPKRANAGAGVLRMEPSFGGKEYTSVQ